MIRDHLAMKACLISCYIDDVLQPKDDMDSHLFDIGALLASIASKRILGYQNTGRKILPAIQEELSIGDDALQPYMMIAEKMYDETKNIMLGDPNDTLSVN